MLCSLLFILVIPSSRCLSTHASPNRNTVAHIKSIVDSKKIDFISSPEEILSSAISSAITRPGHDADQRAKVFYESDLVPRREMSLASYGKFARARHADCLELFDGYKSDLVRCEVLDEKSLNLRWRASWIPAGSTWLYNLADSAGWTVTKRSPDPAKVATFSWRSVFGMFQKAFETGSITLPISCVEGNIMMSFAVAEDEDGETTVDRVSLRETIDLVSEADKNRLQNRRVAQELSSWLDVSRRPPGDGFGIDEAEWASIVRGRILTGVPGAGALDVDPNEDDAEGGVASRWNT